MSDDVAVRPFRIDVPDDALEDYAVVSPNSMARSRARRRLEPGRSARLDPVHVPVLGQEVRLARSRSALNRFHQFVTEIDGLDIHFIHHARRMPTRCR